MKTYFTHDQFVPTQWDSSDVKAAFANHFLRFIEAGFKETMFTQKFYTRLSMTFGHIAHCNRLGFWETWFSSTRNQVQFLEHTLRHGCYGDPTFTYSDVESAIQQKLNELGTFRQWSTKLLAECGIWL